MSPREFMQRLAAPVPRPHLIRFHGVLAPDAGLRAAIVPGRLEKPSEDAEEHTHRRARVGRACAIRSGCVEMNPGEPRQGSNSHRKRGIVTKHRTIDRLSGRRYSRGWATR